MLCYYKLNIRYLKRYAEGRIVYMYMQYYKTIS